MADYPYVVQVKSYHRLIRKVCDWLKDQEPYFVGRYVLTTSYGQAKVAFEFLDDATQFRLAWFDTD